MSRPSRARGGYGTVVVLGLLGALVFWLSGLTGNTAGEDAEELARLRAGDGVQVTGTMTGSPERQQASRRTMVTVHCAVYTFATRDAGSSSFTSDVCARDAADLPATGSTAPVIYDPDGWSRFLDTDDTAERLDRDAHAHPWYRWGGLALAVACAALLVRRLLSRLPRSRAGGRDGIGR